VRYTGLFLRNGLSTQTDKQFPRQTLAKDKHMLRFLILSVIAISLASNAKSGESVIIDVAKTSSCGCCIAWIDHLKENGFTVKSRNMAMGQLTRHKLDNGIGPKTAACHTGKVDGYTIEGHVPVREIRRLLKEKPDVIGLAVPGMPIGSPGMDFSEDREPFDVLLVRRDGSTEVFSSYPGSK
jgi:hypothetical protein